MWHEEKRETGLPPGGFEEKLGSMRAEQMVAGVKGRIDSEGNENVSERQGAGKTGAEGHPQASVSVPGRIMASWIRELGNTSRICVVVCSAC